jgi:hypothetical protein
MKATIKKPADIEIAAVNIQVAVRYGDEDMPFDFPHRKDDMWDITVDIDTGRIRDWPADRAEDVYMKVCDCGSYYLLDAAGKRVGFIENDYVPHGVVPGEYGDYIDLQINEDGVITNWPKKPNVAKFFASDADDD